MLFGFALLAAGYAGVYYAVNVLVWAHFSTDTAEPVPFAMCVGFPTRPRKVPFMPPVQLGVQIPGAITDARGLLGGVPTTGSYITAGAALAKEGGFFTKSGVPLTGGGPGPLAGTSAGGSAPSFNLGSLEDPATRPRPPGYMGPVAVNPISPGATENQFGQPATLGHPATGVYRQGNMQQNADGTWSPI